MRNFGDLLKPNAEPEVEAGFDLGNDEDGRDRLNGDSLTFLVMKSVRAASICSFARAPGSACCMHAAEVQRGYSTEAG